MKNVKQVRQTLSNDMDFLARSYLLMEMDSRGISKDAFMGNMTVQQKANFETRLIYWREHLSVPAAV